MKILNIDYDNITVPEALVSVFELIEKTEKANVFFLNADCLYKAQKDEEYRDILDKADLLLPDGIGLRLATKLFDGQMKADCNGTDFSPKLIQAASERGLKIYLLGGKEGIAQKAAENIRKQLPKAQVVGTSSGYAFNEAEVINKINQSQADILFVAMGVPLQEKWISRNRMALNPKLCLGVGALLDYYSGSIPRAPLWMRKIHLEWFWRIFVDPKRMIKRYVVDGFGFMICCLWIKLRLKR